MGQQLQIEYQTYRGAKFVYDRETDWCLDMKYEGKDVYIVYEAYCIEGNMEGLNRITPYDEDGWAYFMLTKKDGRKVIDWDTYLQYTYISDADHEMLMNAY